MSREPSTKREVQALAILLMANNYEGIESFKEVVYDQKGNYYEPWRRRVEYIRYINDNREHLGIKKKVGKIKSLSKKEAERRLSEFKYGEMHSSIIDDILSSLVNETTANIGKYLNDLKEQHILERKYWHKKKYINKVGKHGSIWYLGESKEAFIRAFRVLFEYNCQQKRKPSQREEEDVILKFLKTPYFKSKCLYFIELEEGIYGNTSPKIEGVNLMEILNGNKKDDAGALQLIQKFIERKIKDIIRTYKESPTFFEWIVSGKIAHPFLRKIFKENRIPLQKQLTFAKAALQLQDIINTNELNFNAKLMTNFSKNLKILELRNINAEIYKKLQEESYMPMAAQLRMKELKKKMKEEAKGS